MATRKREWFDDDAYWRDLYPYMFSETRLKEAPDIAKNIIRLAKPKGKAVLDLCCGPGRYAVELAKRGYRVVGVDKSRFMLTKARANATKAKVKLDLVRQDMRDFVRPDAFDLVLSIFTSFGFFDDRREDMTVLRNIYSSLRPGGKLLIDTMGKERLAKIFEPVVTEIAPDGTMFVQRHEIFDDWTRVRNEWILVRKGRTSKFKFHITIYSGQELRDRMEQAGFVDIKLYGNFEGDPYGPKAKRLIAVGRKATHGRSGQRLHGLST